MTNRNEQMELLNTFPLEKRITFKEKELSCTAMLILFILPLAAAFYHLMYGGFIFNYDVLPRKDGFIIFSVLGFVLPILAGIINKQYWKGYNNSIEKAVQQDDFLWHTRQKCWGCGKTHTETPKQFNYTKTKMESWRDGAFRCHKNYKKTVSLLLCPNCNTRLSKVKKNSQHNDSLLNVIDVILCFIAAIIFAVIDCPRTSSGVVDVIGIIGVMVIALGVAATMGQIIIYPIAKIISKPLEKKTDNSRTIWNFDDIPAIREFLMNDQHKKIELMVCQRPIPDVPLQDRA